MKILVTGSAGFIGFHLAARLVTEGHEVVGMDNVNEYYDINLKYARLRQAGICIENKNLPFHIKHLSTKSLNYTFYRASLEDLNKMEEIFSNETFDIVVNLAAQAGVRYSLTNPHAYLNSNITGFVNLLECSKKYDVKHFIYASSSSVYGLNKEEIFSTEQPVDHPVSLYAATKRSNELMAHVYSHLYNLPTTGLRFFTVYGPWGRPDMALFQFTKAILENHPIDVYNYGNMSRDFTYVDDVVEGVQRIIEKIPQPINYSTDDALKPFNSTAPYVIYNIGNSKPVNLLDFIGVLEECLEKKACKKLLPLQPGDVFSTYADVTPLIKETGYRPLTPLQVGVKAFVEWYRKFYEV